MSPDKIEYLDSSSINGLNLYCYCVNNSVMYADSSGNFPVIAFIIGGIAVGAVASVIVVLGVKSCTSKNNPPKEDNFLQNAADATIPNMELKDVVKFSESTMKVTIGDLSTKSYTLPNYEAYMNAISKGNYGSYGCERAVFDSTYEEDLFDVIVGQKIWDF